MKHTGAGAPDVTAVITTAHLIIIALLAILAMLVIWWGGRRRRQKRNATHEAKDRRERIDEATPAPSAPADQAPANQRQAAPDAPMTPPTTPAPPPLVDAHVAPISPPAAPAPVAAGFGDAPVTTLKGLGPKVAARLSELGITRVDQIAALSPADAEALDADLGAFSGRMARDRWIEQAHLLAAGDKAGFEAKFGKLG